MQREELFTLTGTYGISFIILFVYGLCGQHCYTIPNSSQVPIRAGGFEANYFRVNNHLLYHIFF